MQLRFWLAIVICAFWAQCVHTQAGESVPDLVPMPKQYQALTGRVAVTGLPLVIDLGNRQCQIGAVEIIKQVRALGGDAGAIQGVGVNGDNPGIYILALPQPAAAALAAELDLAITIANPGPQGYVIHVESNRVVVIGSDAIGALYGAMTLRQMLKMESNQVVVAAARVYDKPDYRYRSAMGVRRGLWPLTLGDKDTMQGYRTGIDWMLHFKMNLMDNHASVEGLIRHPENTNGWNFVREINDYAIERGIYPVLWESTRIGHSVYDDQRPEFQNWDCIYNSKRKVGRYYCWSRDELAQEHIRRVAEFVRACNFKMICVHPVDSGGAYDPENWSKRCQRCRERFGADRWKATVHQFNAWSEILKEVAPDVLFTSPLYPYNAEYADFSRFTGISEDVWRENSIDYWKHIHAGLDPSIIPMTWSARPQNMKVYRECFADRPIYIYAHSFVGLGYFGAWHRRNGTNYEGHPGDIFAYAYYMDTSSKVLWLNQICDCEYAWNTAAPGSEPFDGVYYDAERDHTEPPEIINDWLPRACRAFFGEKLGNAMAPVYQAGVLSRYIQDPGGALALANKHRQKPMADVDPETAGKATNEKTMAPTIVDSATRMAVQVQATTTAMQALEQAYAALDTASPHQRKIVMFFYKRMPLWRLIARARHAEYLAGELHKQGRKDEALELLRKALDEYEVDRLQAEEVLQRTQHEPDLTISGPLDAKRGDVKPAPAEVRAMLESRLASLEVVLHPRPPGEIVKIGLYLEKAPGAQSTKQFFDRFKNVQADFIDSLALAVLQDYDCVFILQTRSVNRADYFDNLPRFVGEGGRGVLFQHDMCGFGRYPFGQSTPFPEICPYADGRRDATNLVALLTHPAMPGLVQGSKTWHMYYDHITPRPGPSGVALAADEMGTPVVVAGEFGHGKVIFDGNINIDSHNQETELSGFNAVLVRGAVEWFTGVKLEEKQ
ncbi:MAG: glycoside hydrolase family 20 zincin-like fold domain-containing protein [Kiritimatiellia bacterium]|jgi:hypothetical protein